MEFILADAFEFNHAMLGKSPEGFDAVDVIDTPNKFIVVMVNTVMLVAIKNKLIIGFLTIGVKSAARGHLMPDYRHQFSSGTVFYNTGKDLASSLE